MTALLILVPIALFLSLVGLAGFVWSLSRGQFDDLDGARFRILMDDDDGRVVPKGEGDDGPAVRRDPAR